MSRAAASPHLDDMLHQAMPDDELGVMEFLEAFALSLTEGATEALADLWQLPAMVISDDRTFAVTDRDELKDLFAGAREQYNSAGVTDTRPEIIRLDEITDRIVMVRVRWPHLDEDGDELGAECSTYTLQLSALGDWKIRCAILHGCEALN